MINHNCMTEGKFYTTMNKHNGRALAMSEQDDDTGFMHSLGGIKPLRQDRIDPQAQKPRPEARVGQNKHVTADPALRPGRHQREDPQTWFDAGLQKNKIRQMKLGQIPIDVRCDLHGFSQQQARRELTQLLHLAGAQNLRLLLIIHGKGYKSEHQAVLKPFVHDWLSRQPSVLAWCPAQARHGGSGATYVYLKRL